MKPATRAAGARRRATDRGRVPKRQRAPTLLVPALPVPPVRTLRVWVAEAEDGVPGSFFDERLDRIVSLCVEERARDRRVAQVFAQNRPGFVDLCLGDAEALAVACAAEFDPTSRARVLHPVSLSIGSHEPALVAVHDQLDRRRVAAAALAPFDRQKVRVSSSQAETNQRLHERIYK